MECVLNLKNMFIYTHKEYLLRESEPELRLQDGIDPAPHCLLFGNPRLASISVDLRANVRRAANPHPRLPFGHSFPSAECLCS